MNIYIKFNIISYLLIAFLSIPCAYGLAAVDEEVLKQGINYVDNMYDAGKAVEKFREVLVSDTAAPGLKIQAGFWLAHTWLFEGEEAKARLAIREALEIAAGEGLDYLSGLPVSITGNNKLMYIFNAEKDECLSGNIAVGGEETRIVEVPEKPAIVEYKKGKKLAFGKLFVGSIMAVAYIVLIALV